MSAGETKTREACVFYWAKDPNLKLSVRSYGPNGAGVWHPDDCSCSETTTCTFFVLSVPLLAICDALKLTPGSKVKFDGEFLPISWSRKYQDPIISPNHSGQDIETCRTMSQADRDDAPPFPWTRRTMEDYNICVDVAANKLFGFKAAGYAVSVEDEE